jgi:hypothetical protein
MPLFTEVPRSLVFSEVSISPLENFPYPPPHGQTRLISVSLSLKEVVSPHGYRGYRSCRLLEPPDERYRPASLKAPWRVEARPPHLVTISKLSRSAIIAGDPYRKKPQR